jgi:hypothetical protein
MVRFSSDIDILKHEPVLFGELHLPSQVLTQDADAELSGTTLTDGAGNFTGTGVEAGGVICLKSADGALDGSYEIVSVDSATRLTVSVLRADTADSPIAPPQASDISYRVSTFAAQATEAAFQLTEYFGIQPGNPTSEITIDNVVDTEGLQRASAFAVISAVYATWASRIASECHWQKSLHYKQLFEKARQRCRLSIDLGTDGIADIARLGGAIKLLRD